MEENTLQLTSNDRIVYEEGKEVDPSAKKLVDRIEHLRQKRTMIDQEIDALNTALGVMGMSVESRDIIGDSDPHRFETRYSAAKPFREMTLGPACLKILADHAPSSLDKNQTEFLLTIGGYPFKAKDPTNSVEVTLRKLASDGKCEADKPGGPHGSRYRAKVSGQE